jgi:tetratricopeptide (TPR) repeat protein
MRARRPARVVRRGTAGKEDVVAPVSRKAILEFERLPQRSGECWQGGLLRLPTWIPEGPQGKPYRPWAGVWTSLGTGFVHLTLERQPGTADWTLALEALVEFGLKRNLMGCRPERLEVADRELGARLLDALGDSEISLVVSPDVPEAKRVLAEMGERMGEGPLPPGALEAPGVTVERLRAFAEAAKGFYEAAPWRLLSSEDLIHVEAPRAMAELEYAVVLGGGGEVFGLGFFESEGEYRAFAAWEESAPLPGGARWSVFFGPIYGMPFPDADLWEEHGLPVAGEEAYPVAVRFNPDGTVSRPDAGVLSYLEGLLRALAATTDEEIDRGRWTRDVHTADGPATYQLALPSLLLPLDAPDPIGSGPLVDRREMERALLEIERIVDRSGARTQEDVQEILTQVSGRTLDAIPSSAETPLERAQDLAYRAFGTRGRRRILLARKALELSPDCADAYVILAEEAGSVEEACDLYAQAVAAGERALGQRAFAEDAGHFWGLVRTRPYMRARFGLAQCLEALGRVDDAIVHYRDLLRLNPGDNQGVRYSLLAALLARGRDEEAGALLRQFGDEPSAIWLYGWALWSFRREGDTPVSRQRLRRALRANRRVAAYLTGEDDLPVDEPQAYAPGSEEEAVLCARLLQAAWRATPGASAWLESPRRQRGAARKSRRRSRR